MQQTWSFIEKLSAGKRERGGCMGQQPSQQSLSPQAVTVATIKNKATVIMGEEGNASVEIMFDSGSAVSLLRKRDMEHMKSLQHVDKHPQVTLITAAGEPLAVVGHVRTTVLVGGFEVVHQFVVAEHLIYPCSYTWHRPLATK